MKRMQVWAAVLVVTGVTLSAGSALSVGETSVTSGMENWSVGFSCHFDAGCYCTSGPPHLGRVQCRDWPLELLPALNSSKIFSLTLINNNLDYLQPFGLSGTGLYKLYVSNNPLYTMHEECLAGLERSLWELHIVYCHLNTVPYSAIRHLSKLKTLNLTGNHLTTVSADQLRGVSASLQYLILAHNRISSLPPGVFAGLPFLRELDLSSNSIQILSPALFTPPPPNLSKLDLRDNHLTVVPYQQLTALKSLRSVDLSWNFINTIKDQTGGTRLSLDEVYFEYNNIDELETGAMSRFAAANRTSFRGNPLVQIEVNAFQGSRISDLVFRDCRLSSIDDNAFNGIENTLQHLDLSGNNITTLNYTLLMKCDALRELILDQNPLTSVDWMSPPKPTSGKQQTQQGPAPKPKEIELLSLSLRGKMIKPLDLRSFPRLSHLQTLILGKTTSDSITGSQLEPFSVELETLKISSGSIKSLAGDAFRFVRGVKVLDLTDNALTSIDSKAFVDIGHSLEALYLVHALDRKFTTISKGTLKPLGAVRDLRLNHNHLTKVPDDLPWMSALEELHAHDNVINSLPPSLFKPSAHKKLNLVNLSFNKISKLDNGTFSGLDSLRSIDLSDNALTSVGGGAFANLPSLSRLRLRGNKLSLLGIEALQNLPYLSLLDLAYNSLRDFSFTSLDQVGTLTSFHVNLSHNELNSLTGNLSHNGGRYSVYTNVKLVDLSHNNISSVDKLFFAPVQDSLTHLILSHNNMKSASRDVFPSMPHLQLLDISHNSLTDLEFDTFRHMDNLQTLNLGRNQLKSLPMGIFSKLSSLLRLDISHNQLNTIPDATIAPAAIFVVNMSYNRLNRAPLTAFTPSAAASVHLLDMSGNQLASLPSSDSFSRFSTLRVLDLSDNRLSDVGSSLSGLTSLNRLSLAHNTMHFGPRDFSGLENCLQHLNLNNVTISYPPPLPLPSLLTLDLGHNGLPFVSVDLRSNLTSLRSFDLSYNLLTTSPPSFPTLETLKLTGNPFMVLGNTTFTDFSGLTELDISRIPIKGSEFDMEALNPLRNLYKLKIGNFKEVTNFNLPQWIRDLRTLRELHIDVMGTASLGKDMSGNLPPKVDRITVTGKDVKTLPDYIIRGVLKTEVTLIVSNSSIESISRAVFTDLPHVRNISLIVDSSPVKSIANPCSAPSPGLPGKDTYLMSINLNSDKLNCDCELGWMETWQRKRRQANLWSDCATEQSRSLICENKQKKPVLTAFKEDIECGWSAGCSLKITTPLLIGLILIRYL